jgi:hypothetical protein
MIFTIPNSLGAAPLVEFNRCHRPGGNPSGGQFGSKDACAAYITPGEVKHEKRSDWGKVNHHYYVLGRNRTNSDWFPTEGQTTSYDKNGFLVRDSLPASLLRGKPLSPDELEALPGRMLYHVTTNLEGVLATGALTAKRSTTSPGLGGGQYPAVSFTTNAEDARNIFTVMAHAQRVAKGEDLKAVLTDWAKTEGATFGPETTRSLLKAVGEAVKWYNFSMTDAFSATVGAGLSPEGEAAAQYAHRQSVAKDAFNQYVNRRGSLKVGHDPILFTNFEALAKAGTVAILALPQRALRTQAKRVVINAGADEFQQEIEIHGDVPVAGGFYFTGGSRVRTGPRWTPHLRRSRRKAKT